MFDDLFINNGDEFSYYLNAYGKNEDKLRYLKIKEADYLCSKKKICEEFENYLYIKTVFKNLKYLKIKIKKNLKKFFF